MPYINAKIYSDGGHYVAIPQGAYPSRKGRNRRGASCRRLQNISQNIWKKRAKNSCTAESCQPLFIGRSR